jgi:hypothetical protein
MKTYTHNEWCEYMNYREGHQSVPTGGFNYWELPTGGFNWELSCNCIRRYPLTSTYLKPYKQIRAFKDCKTCLGYGIMPIPWSELKK